MKIDLIAMQEPELAEELEALRQERVTLLAALGVTEPAGIEHELARYVQACLTDLEKAIVDIEPAQKSMTKSHNSPFPEGPSQNFGDIENEIVRLRAWLKGKLKTKGGGRRPALRKELSSYALAIMLGERPFGRFAALHEELEFERAESNGKPAVSKRTIVKIEWLSEDEMIHHRQFKGARAVRGPAGEVWFLRIVEMPIPWPPSFLNLVAAHRTGPEALHLPTDVIERDLDANEYPQMLEGLDLTLEMLAIWRRREDQRNKATLPRWASSEPVFRFLVRAMTLIRSISKGVDFPALERSDLAANLVLWVQTLVDNKDCQSSLYRRYGPPEVVLGRKPTNGKRPASAHTRTDQLGERAGEVAALISALRIEDAAYYWAKSTVRMMLIGLQASVQNPELRAASEHVSGIVVTALDKHWELRRRLLQFGSDNTQGETYKWFGDGSGRTTGHTPREVAECVFPSIGNKAVFLQNLDRLVMELDLEPEPVRCWGMFVAWAREAGWDHWAIEPRNHRDYLWEMEEQTMVITCGLR